MRFENIDLIQRLSSDVVEKVLFVLGNLDFRVTANSPHTPLLVTNDKGRINIHPQSGNVEYWGTDRTKDTRYSSVFRDGHLVLWDFNDKIEGSLRFHFYTSPLK